MSINLTDNQILAILNEFQKQISCSTTTQAGYPVNLNFDYNLLLPFFQYHLNNAGDPFIQGYHSLHTKEFEKKCLHWFAQLYKLEDSWGYITSGGTEANLYGIFLGRELYCDGILYSSVDTHYSIAKIARLLKIPHVIINSQANGEINYEHLEEELSKRKQHSAILNLNLGTTMKGAVDRIETVVEILQKLKMPFHIHCDAALGGLLLPFIHDAPNISFQEYPIGSIAVSGHKFIGSPIPYGIVLTRRSYVHKLETTIEYIGSNDSTIIGSRNGLAALLLWYAIQTRGQSFNQEVSTCLQNAQYLHKCLLQMGYSSLLNEFSNIVVFENPGIELCRKWQLATQGNLAHIVVMQHICVEKIDNFIRDLSLQK